MQLSPEHYKIVRDILHTLVPERDVRVFGSRARGDAKPHSDLDLVLLGSELLKGAIRAQLELAFEESDLPFRVDLVEWDAISPSFRKAIEDECHPFMTSSS